MVKIEWSLYAYEDLESIFNFIAKDSIFYANRQVEVLVSRVEILEAFPQSGRIVPEFNNELIRELIEGNYRVVYKIQKDFISILRVHHAAKDIS
ncbi:MAG: type II toxin-antitoxin system RelE/ParE family toxin [Cytophagaceae bacterium]